MPLRPFADMVILFEDADCLVIDKPAGLAVHPGPKTADSLETRLKAAGAKWQPAHRLDRDTSGCLLLAKRPAARRRLMQAFAARQVAKTYLAVVAPPPPGDAGVVDFALAKRSAPRRGWWMEAGADGQPARTRWQVLARAQATALVQLEPVTGRTHQLRVHATALAQGAAIVGDAVYGRGEPGGLMLHAWRLGFPDIAGRRIEVVAPLPGRFRTLGFAAG
ncbi:RluA family pseudouridine synthase [Thermaurantiacus sp.]